MPIKICFVLPSLRAGGAERVVSTLAQKLDASKYNVVIIVLGFKRDAKYAVKDIDVIYLNRPRLIASILPLFKALKKLKPDIAMSSIGHVNQVMAMFSIYFKRTKFIAREASVISSISQFANPQFKIPHKLTAKLYRRFDAIVCQSKDMKTDLEQLYNIKKDGIKIINNPVNLTFKTKTQTKLNNPVTKLITIGRLSEEKGQKRIIDALVKSNLNFELLIVGTGHLLETLKEKVEHSNIKDKVNFLDYSNSINTLLMNYDFYLQGSYVEGFPNALLEACASGIPVLAFNAPGGTKEIIEPGINGYIATTESDFITYLEQMMRKEWSPSDIRASVVSKFHPNTIVANYEELFDKIVHIEK